MPKGRKRNPKNNSEQKKKKQNKRQQQKFLDHSNTETLECKDLSGIQPETFVSTMDDLSRDMISSLQDQAPGVNILRGDSNNNSLCPNSLQNTVQNEGINQSQIFNKKSDSQLLGAICGQMLHEEAELATANQQIRYVEIPNSSGDSNLPINSVKVDEKPRENMTNIDTYMTEGMDLGVNNHLHVMKPKSETGSNLDEQNVPGPQNEHRLVAQNDSSSALNSARTIKSALQSTQQPLTNQNNMPTTLKIDDSGIVYLQSNTEQSEGSASFTSPQLETQGNTILKADGKIAVKPASLDPVLTQLKALGTQSINQSNITYAAVTSGSASCETGSHPRLEIETCDPANQTSSYQHLSNYLKTELSVTFTVWTHSWNFSMNEQCIIICGGPIFQWKSKVVDMHVSEQLTLDNVKYILLKGEVSFPKEYLTQPLPYKYAFLESTEIRKWECFEEDYLCEGIVNRQLVVSDLLVDSVEVLDDIVLLSTGYHINACETATILYLVSFIDFDQIYVTDLLRKSNRMLKDLKNKCLIYDKGLISRRGNVEKVILKYQMFLLDNKIHFTRFHRFHLKMAAFYCIFFLDRQSGLVDPRSTNTIFSMFKDSIISLQHDETPKLDFLSPSELTQFQQGVQQLLYEHFSLIKSKLKASQWSDCGAWISALPFLEYTIDDKDKYIEIQNEILTVWQKEIINLENGKFEDIWGIIAKLRDERYFYVLLRVSDVRYFIQILNSEEKLRMFQPRHLLEKFISCSKQFKKSELVDLIRKFTKFMKTVIQTSDIKENTLIINVLKLQHHSIDPSHTFREEIFMFSFEIASELQKQKGDLKSEIGQFLTELLQPLLCTFKSKPSENLSASIQKYSQAMEYYKHSQEFQDSIIQHFEENVLETSSVKYCLNTFIEWNLNIDSRIFQVFLDRILNLLTHSQQENKSFLSWIKDTGSNVIFGNDLKKLANFISTIFLRHEIAEIVNEINCIKVTIDLIESAYVIPILDLITHCFDNLSEDTKVKHSLIKENIVLLESQLAKGRVTLTALTRLTSNEKSSRLIQLMTYFLGKNTRPLIERRMVEFSEYGNDLSTIKDFLHFIKVKLHMKLPKEKASLDKFSSSDNILENVCSISKAYNDSQAVKCKHQFAEDDVRQMSYFNKRTVSKTFIEICQQQKTSFMSSESHLTLEDVILFCKNVFQQFEKIITDISEGTIKLQSIKDLFSDVYRRGGLEQELDIIKDLGTIWPPETTEQIETVCEILKYTEFAEVIRNVVNILNLDTEYPAIDIILNSVSNEEVFFDQPLRSIDNDTVRCYKVLSKMSESLVSALKSFCKCGNLIVWVRENIKTAQELKVFVDLASISAGECDIDVNRILCFQSAIMAYSTFFFDLPKDQRFEKFLAACENLEIGLNRDTDAEKKLIDANRYVRWIQLIKDRHGSVEDSSLKMVQLINDSGVFKISVSSNVKMIEIVLEYQLEMAEIETRTIKIQEMKYLESKLMLISVPVDERIAVDRFTQILHQIILIGRHLETLIEDGCHLFNQFSFNCSMKRDIKSTTNLDFGYTSSFISGISPLEEELKIICDFLNCCKVDWKNHMQALRKECPVLNYFTTNQLVGLCTMLASLETDTSSANPGRDLSMLIQHLIPEADTTDLLDSLISTTQQHTVRESSSQENYSDTNIINDISNEYTIDKSMIKRAIEAIGSEKDRDAIVDWCLLNIGNNNTSENEGSTEIGSGASDLGTESSNSDMENSETTEGHEDLNRESPATNIEASNHEEKEEIIDDSKMINDLNKTWSVFLSRDQELNVDDFIGFKNLSEILQNLIEKFRVDSNRKFPKFLKPGIPNLIICSQYEMHSAVLSIYQYDKKKPLPGFDEILICNKTTTLEQITLHCLRAFQDKSGKIYSIIHTDKIDFETSYSIEQLCLNTETDHTYRLVFFSNKENDRHSFISSAFNCYRAIIPTVRSETLRKYMHNHLRNTSIEMAGLPHLYNLMIIASHGTGDGKSLLVNRINEDVCGVLKTKVLHQESIDFGSIIKSWNSSLNETNVFHLDITESVADTCEDLVFYLAVCQGIMDTMGALWKCNSSHLYLIELTVPNFDTESEIRSKASFKRTLPTIWCNSPDKSCHIYAQNPQTGVFTENEHGYLHFMDNDIFMSDCVQRPFQYLMYYDNNDPLDEFTYTIPNEDRVKCLEILIRYCSIADPSWSELVIFCNFLNLQLQSCEESIFCNFEIIEDSLPGFKNFVVKFLILMSKDFGTRSVDVSDSSILLPKIIDRNRWENNPHPYIFFNDDRQTFSFFGFQIQNLNLVDEMRNRILEENCISQELYECIEKQDINLNRSMELMTSHETRTFYINQLLLIFGISIFPEELKSDYYELTSDNVLKMMAIHMRFRANIPVIIMGETGTGKTRLIRFICDLQRQEKTERKNMVIMKCHGGVNETNVYNAVRKAILLARENMKDGVLQTVLFFDEANTTNAIGAIKEVMVDGLVDGEPIPKDIGLKFVAAVNPYREHSAEMIEKLEKAGLGYHMKAEQTSDRIGSIPMRRLVYRVKPIPPSLFSLIWDFGILDESTEIKYITQMVQRYTTQQNWPVECEPLLVSLLSVCQEFMRNQKDECSFVSLRDVERTLIILEWFMKKCEYILERIKSKYLQDLPELDSNLYYSMIWAIGVSYYVRLENRDLFMNVIFQFFSTAINLQNNEPSIIFEIIDICQRLFIDELILGSNISRNSALKENVWMMAICMELRIPLFLVGKPGSSKSLAKTVVTDVMQGENSYSPLFKKMKEIQMISFQCSPLATADGIRSTFALCQKYQRKQNLDTFVSVVVLDEVGLAEDSPKMPLKTLHPLLEDGCIDDDDEPEPYKKVAFIGISNWALDPAKMNRGVFVSRGTPTKDDLKKTAREICSNDDTAVKLEMYIDDVVEGYEYIYTTQPREFYGLRDFYSLIKLMYCQCERNIDILPKKVAECIQRCFGVSIGIFLPASEFLNKMKSLEIYNETRYTMTKGNLINACFNDIENSRYFLFLTKNNAALKIILSSSSFIDLKLAYIIFGSSFPEDQEYSHLCQNMNRIKVAMELGRTVILCNLTNLYESLYDALNLSYVYLGGSRYVDLGLGTHRVKCRVHPNFRLIVVAEDSEVYERFPIPLINRLEKHFLGMQTLLDSEQLRLMRVLEQWANDFSNCAEVNIFHIKHQNFKPADTFIGYHEDAAASIIYRLSVENPPLNDKSGELLKTAKAVMIQCATPDSISRLRKSQLSEKECGEIFNIYHLEQHHDSLYDFITHDKRPQRLIQITTHCRMMTNSAKIQLASDLKMPSKNISLIFLQQIDTEEQFRRIIEDFLSNCSDSAMEDILIVQCDLSLGNQHENLLESARYCVQDKVQEYHDTCYVIVFLIHLPRVVGGCLTGFPTAPWISAHIDELVKPFHFLNIIFLFGTTISSVLFQNPELFHMLLKECLVIVATQFPSKETRRVLNVIQIINSSSDLQKNWSLRLVSAFKEKIISLLQKEELMHQDQTQWLLNLANCHVHLKEGWTFQQTVWFHLISKVVPHLGKLLRLCDINNGLDIFSNLTGHSQTSVFMIDFFTDTLFACTLNDTWFNIDAIMEVQTYILNRFHSRVPFSWVYVRYFEEIEAQFKKYNSLDVPENPLEHDPVLINLQKFCGKSEKNIIDFISDVVAIKISQQAYNEKFLSIASQCIYSLVRPQTENVAIGLDSQKSAELLESDRDKWSVEAAFQLLVTNLDGLAYVSNIVMLDESILDCPDISKDITLPDFKLDISCTKIALAIAEPNKGHLKSYSAQQKWTALTQELLYIIRNHFGSKSKSYSDNGEVIQYKAKIDPLLRKLDIIILFVHIVFPEDMSSDLRSSVLKYFNLFSASLKDGSLKTKSNFDKFTNVLSEISTESSRLHFMCAIDKCFKCKESIQDPVLLQCGHVGCFKCIEEVRCLRLEKSKKNKWNCPFKNCKSQYDSEYQLVRTTECKDIVSKHYDFRRTLNMFFVEVLQRFVFDGKTEPEIEIMHKLLGYVVTKKMHKQMNASEIVTREMSLFSGDYVDKSPVIRSFILQLILKCQWNEAHKFLESFLQDQKPLITNSNIFIDICQLIVYSMEECTFEKELQFFADTSVTDKRKQACNKIRYCSDFDFTTLNLLEKLRFVAQSRVDLNLLSDALRESINEKNVNEDTELLIKSTIKLFSISQKECMQDYLVRLFAGKFSMNAVKEWKSSGFGSELLPTCLQRATLNYVQDVFLILGQEYLDIRQLLRDSVFENTTDKLLPFLTGENKTHQFYLSCAFFYFMTIEADEILTSKIPEFLQENELLLEVGSRFMPDNIQSCPILSHALETHITSQDRAIFSLIFHLSEAIQHAQKRDTIANVFWTMVDNPNSLLLMYLPTMPQDDNYISMLTILGNRDNVMQYYLCPNGHPFGVGDCGGLEDSGDCNECGAVIGKNQLDTERFDPTDSTQPGYALKPVQDVNEAATNMRDMSPLHVAVIRFLLHCCMYISAGGPGKDTISAMVHDADIHGFLMQNLRLNCNQITRALGQSEDATIVLLHSIVMAMRDINSTDQHSLANITDRRVWENAFVRSIINPCTARLNETFQRFQSDLQNDSGSGEDLIYDVLRGTDSEKDTSTEADIPFVPAFWFYRRRLTLDNLGSYLETDPNVEKHHRLSEVCPSLFYLMANRELLQHTPSLIDIIRLQNILVHNFSGRLEYQEIENQTIKQFLLLKVENNLRQSFDAQIRVYLSTLSQLHRHIYQFDAHGRAAKELLDSFPTPLQLSDLPNDPTQWPASLLFPSNRGLGMLSKVLVSVLIRAHNAAVTSKQPEPSAVKLSVSQLDRDSLLVWFSHSQLLLLLLSCSQVDLHIDEQHRDTSNPATLHRLDYESLERRVFDRYFRGKRMINTSHRGLPEFKFWSPTLPWVPHSRPLADLDKESVVPQTVLPQALCMQLETEMTADLPELCRLLSVLHTARDLVRITAVANSAAASKMPLLDEMERLGLLRDTDPLRRSRFLRARPGVELRHLDDLVHALQLLRTRRMLARRQDPWFEVVPDSMREPMLPLSSTIAGDSSSLIRSEEETGLIRPLLVAVSGPLLLDRLQLFISAASSTDQLIVQPHWDLASTLAAFLETRDDQNTAKLIQKHLPVCVLVKHTTALFEAALCFIDK